jgi:hypothetical protein
LRIRNTKLYFFRKLFESTTGISGSCYTHLYNTK